MDGVASLILEDNQVGCAEDEGEEEVDMHVDG